MRIVLMSLLLGASLWGQGKNTVYQTLMTAGKESDTATIRNIGQTFHNLLVRSYDKPGAGGCSTTVFDYGYVSFEGSFDGGANYVGIKYFAVPYKTYFFSGSGWGTTQTIISAAGAYPLLRVRIALNDDTKCLLAVDYAGSLTGQDVSTFTALRFDTPVNHAGEYSTIGTHVLSIFSPGARWVIYGLHVYNGGAGQNIVLEDSAGTDLIKWTNAPVGVLMDAPQVNDPLFILPPNLGLSLTLSANTPVTIMYRLRAEP